ncbi:hypothetical protein [Actinomadura rudentiformis]|uniref:hypothetical protein n=1 Tax=Actinomadura rudentiformis TaxID=359158 RepID=UPI001CEF9B0C|nr:hypothetical protein [Actinomadura rudentiformis]
MTAEYVLAFTEPAAFRTLVQRRLVVIAAGAATHRRRRLPPEPDSGTTRQRARASSQSSRHSRSRSLETPRPKTNDSEESIKRLIKQEAPVQRVAGVSHSFLYGHVTLRRRIEQLWAHQASALDQARS